MLEKKVYLEAVTSKKSNLGANVIFENNALELKKNAIKKLGIFSCKPITENTIIMSVDLINGSLSPLRAYEEAAEMIKPLGLDHYYLEEEFIITCALYLRYKNSSTSPNDILVLNNNIKNDHTNSPLNCFGSYELDELLGYNDHTSAYRKQLAQQQDAYIKKLGVDETLFRLLLARTTTEIWNAIGVIPVLEWVNDAYNQDPNATFVHLQDNKIGFRALRQINKGEEIVWSFNNRNAIDTWFSFGYMCTTKPAAARLHRLLSQEELQQIRFLKDKIKLPDKWNFQKGVSEPLRWTIDLPLPRKHSSDQNYKVQAAMCYNKFKEARTQFRVLLLSLSQSVPPSTTLHDLEDDKPSWGASIEKEVISEMHKAIESGLQDTLKRVHKFQASRFGQQVDLQPYIDLRVNAAKNWSQLLEQLEKLYRHSKFRNNSIMAQFIKMMMDNTM